MQWPNNILAVGEIKVLELINKGSCDLLNARHKAYGQMRLVMPLLINVLDNTGAKNPVMDFLIELPGILKCHRLFFLGRRAWSSLLWPKKG